MFGPSFCALAAGRQCDVFFLAKDSGGGDLLLNLEVKKKSKLYVGRSIVGIYVFDSKSGSMATSNLTQKSVSWVVFFF